MYLNDIFESSKENKIASIKHKLQFMVDHDIKLVKLLLKNNNYDLNYIELAKPEELVDMLFDVIKSNNNIMESLRQWFKEKWVRFGPDGKIRGDCARGDDSEGKPKCLPRSKANALGKKGRASAASRKRRKDPDPERSGPAINVSTKRKNNEGITAEQGSAMVTGIPQQGVAEAVSTDTIHKLADLKGIKWDNEPNFLKLTKQLTGKAYLDDLDQAGLEKVKRYLDRQDVAEGSLNEFAPDTGGGDGRWYTDDEITDIIGEDWLEFDLSGEAANISRHGEHAKILLVQEAQAYFEDRGYHGVVVQDVRDNEDFLSWYISGNFTRLDEGVAEGFTDDLDNVYAMHPQPEKSEKIAFLILDKDETEFATDWRELSDPYQQEFGYDLPLWDADDFGSYPNLVVKQITFEQYVNLVGNYIQSEELAGSAISKMKRGVAEGLFGSILPWPEIVKKVNGAMKATGWKVQRQSDDAFMYSTKGQETDDQYYIVIISNVGNNHFEYVLGTVEEGDPHIGEKDTLPMTPASVSELMNAIRDGFGLNERKQGVAEASTTLQQSRATSQTMKTARNIDYSPALQKNVEAVIRAAHQQLKLPHDLNWTNLPPLDGLVGMDIFRDENLRKIWSYHRDPNQYHTYGAADNKLASLAFLLKGPIGAVVMVATPDANMRIPKKFTISATFIDPIVNGANSLRNITKTQILPVIKKATGKINVRSGQILVANVYQGHENKISQRQQRSQESKKDTESMVAYQKITRLIPNLLQQVEADIIGNVQLLIKNKSYDRAKIKIDRLDTIRNLEGNIDSYQSMTYLIKANDLALYMTASHLFPDQTGGITRTYGGYAVDNMQGVGRVIDLIADNNRSTLGIFLAFFKRALLLI